MMTHAKIAADNSGKAAAHYYKDTTVLPDQYRALGAYYGGWDATGTWRRDMSDDIAKALGIDRSQKPTLEKLELLFEGRRADNGEKWTAEKREISAVDLQTAVHKSVTLAIVRAKSDAERAALLQAVWRANDAAVRAFMGRLGVARVGKAGRDGHVPGDAAWCSFMHFSSRPTHPIQDGPDGPTLVKSLQLPADPHIHIHNPVWNLLACEDGKLRAIDFAQLRHLKEFGGVFQAELADELRALGVRTRYNETEQAAVIDVVPDDMSLLFSKGRASVIVKAKLRAEELGLDWNKLSAKAKNGFFNQAAQDKLAKNDGISDSERWEAEALEAGWEHTTCMTGEPPLNLTDEQRMEQAAAFTARHLAKEFETTAVVDLEVFRRIAAWSLIGVGIKDHQDVNRVVEATLDRGIEFDGRHSKLVLGRTSGKIRLTHSVQIELEQAVQSLAFAMGTDHSRSLTPEQAEQAIAASCIDYTDDPGKTIGAEQRNAACAMINGPALVYVEGVAGTGKTTRVLPPAVTAWKAAGRRVVGLCQAWRQTDELCESGIEERYAVSVFLEGIKDGRIKVDGDTVLVVDETAQLAPCQFIELQRLWMQHGTILRSMGDREQCQAIMAAGAAELFTRDNILPGHALPTISETVRQRTEEERETATMFRNDGTSAAIAIKRQNGTAKLVGGDYDQIVARHADRYLELRDQAAEKGWTKGVIVVTPTNHDAAEISKNVRARLKHRGEIDQSEVMYQAIDNRGSLYNLPVAVGDRHRLFKKTYGYVNGAFKSVGSNGDIVEITGFWKDGLRFRTKRGEVAEVRWSSLKDRDTGRLKMGYGHALTIDAAQGLTDSATHFAMPQGTAGITAFKTYVAMSRHTEMCEVWISEAAMREAVQEKRPLGDMQPITEDDLWTRAVTDMADKPRKSLAIDLLNDVLNNQDALVDDLLRLDQRLQKVEERPRNFAEEIFGKVQEIRLRDTAELEIAGIERAIHARSRVLANLRDHMEDTMRDLREQYLLQDPGFNPAWFNRPSVEPGLGF